MVVSGAGNNRVGLLRQVSFFASLSVLAALVCLFVYGHVVRKSLTSVAGCCEMLYMNPSYVDVPLPTYSPLRFGSYRLLRFDDRSRLSYPRPLGSCSRPPAIFVPGHWGSADQGRSLGAHGNLRRPDARHPASFKERNAGGERDDKLESLLAEYGFPFSSAASDSPIPFAREFDLYILDFGGESSVFHARQLKRQAAYVSLAVRHIVDVVCLGSPHASVVLVGHSFGGLAALYSAAAGQQAVSPGGTTTAGDDVKSKSTIRHVPPVSAVVALASPLRRSPVTLDGSIAQLYEDLHKRRKEILVPLLSLSGSLRDELVGPYLTSSTLPNSLAIVPSQSSRTSASAIAAGLDGHPCGMDHRAMCWCSHVMSQARDAILLFSNASSRCYNALARKGGIGVGEASAATTTGCEWSAYREKEMLKDMMAVTYKQELERRMEEDEKLLRDSLNAGFPLRYACFKVTSPHLMESISAMWVWVGAGFFIALQHFGGNAQLAIFTSSAASLLLVAAYFASSGETFEDFVAFSILWATTMGAQLLLCFVIFPLFSLIITSILPKSFAEYRIPYISCADDALMGSIGAGVFAIYFITNAPVGPSLTTPSDPLPPFFFLASPSEPLSADAMFAYSWLVANFAIAYEYLKAACLSPWSPGDPSCLRRRFLATFLVPYLLLTVVDYAVCWDLIIGQFEPYDKPSAWTDAIHHAGLGTIPVFCALKIYNNRANYKKNILSAREGFFPFLAPLEKICYGVLASAGLIMFLLSVQMVTAVEAGGGAYMIRLPMACCLFAFAVIEFGLKSKEKRG